jgi:hypothetical protein
MSTSFLSGLEVFFAGAALGTDPVLGQFGKGGAGGDAVAGISFGGVIDVTTDDAAV